MLCQKCGLREAAVIIETTVFRQRIEEHLCELCAGDPRPVESPPTNAPVFSRPGRTLIAAVDDNLDDPVGMYLKQMGQVPLLTREQEVEISERIENAELKAQKALFQATAVGGYIALLGAKLLNRKERFDRIVIDKKIESRDAYFRTLPKLVESTQKAEAGADEAWKEQAKARSDPDRARALSKFRRRETMLRANFPKFYFKLKVYEEYLEQLRPVLEEIDGFHA